MTDNFENFKLNFQNFEMKQIYLIKIETPQREHGSPVTPSVCHTLVGARKPMPSDLAHWHAQFSCTTTFYSTWLSHHVVVVGQYKKWCDLLLFPFSCVLGLSCRVGFLNPCLFFMAFFWLFLFKTHTL
jgi:hypothetical protein